MNKTNLVLRNEIVSTLGRKSFLFTLFGLPAIGVLIFLGASLLRNRASGSASEAGSPPEPSDLQVEGYVDEGGLIAQLPQDLPEGILQPYPDEASARQAMKRDEIAAYYVIPADYVARGDLVYVNPQYSPADRSADQSWAMKRTLFVNLLGNNPQRVERAVNVMQVQEEALAPQTSPRDEDSALNFYIPYGTTMITYIVTLMAASLMMNSVSEEKKNRVMEVLVSSVSPRQLLTGKIVGLGLLGLLQAVLWIGTGYTLLRLSGRTLNLPPEFELPLSLLAWALLFFLLGYAIYASLMAGLGALAPGTREASQAVIVVIWPLLIPLFLMVSLIEDTHGPIATALSLIPLTAPVAMMTRLSIGGVPAWQPLLAAALMLVTILVILRAVARMFRAQTLLSGEPLTVRGFLAALLGRM